MFACTILSFDIKHYGSYQISKVIMCKQICTVTEIRHYTHTWTNNSTIKKLTKTDNLYRQVLFRLLQLPL